MATVSVSVPEDLRQKIVQHDEVNWSAVARRAFEEKIKQIEFMKTLANKSMLTEADAVRIGRKINESMAKRFREVK